MVEEEYEHAVEHIKDTYDGMIMNEYYVNEISEEGVFRGESVSNREHDF